MDYTKKTVKFILSILIVVIGLIHLIPFYVLVTTSLKGKGDFSSKWAFPIDIEWSNFAEAWEQANLGSALMNSIIITFFAGLLLIVLGSMAAYPLARRQTKLNKFVFALIISIMVVPPLTALVPLYKLVVDIGMMNTRTIAVLNNVASFSPLAIFLYTSFIRSTVPKELEEAARIDGASTMGIFFKIVFPLLKPITATVLIVTCVYIWNDFQFAIFFLQADEVKTFTVTLQGFFGENTNNLNLVGAASIITMLPMTILFLFLQRFFIRGLAGGAVKG